MSRIDLRGELQKIYDQYGELSAELVAEVARPKNHPLHGRVYDRPRKEAADAWYIYKAEELIKSVTVTRKDIDGEVIQVRWFSPVRESQPGVYDPLDVIVEDDVRFKRLLLTMEIEWKSMRRRYGHIERFREMVREDVA